MLEGDKQQSLADKDLKEELNNNNQSNKKPNKKCLIISIISCAVGVGAIIALIIVLLKKDDKEKKLNFLTWEEAHKKAKDKIKEFTIEEKLSLLFGIQNMQKTKENGCVGSIEPIPNKFGGICLQDGPAGVRFSTSTQSWQAAINTASTFNKTLMYEVGKAQGKEFREKGINIALGPAMNFQRNPQGGRIWESYGDDPFLAGVVATQVIKGIQSNGVIACAKHYVANDQETNRKNSSSNVKEQALWEIYIEPFYRSVIDAEVGSIMTAYNAINGIYCVNNSLIVKEYLKEKIGFKGFAMTDWWEVMSYEPDNFNNGVDMNMPGGIDEGPKYVGRNNSYWSNFKTYLDNGKITYERLDDAVERILAPMYKLDQFSSDVKFPEVNLNKNTITDETKKLNREAAAQSNVLLRNIDNILPLKNMEGKTIAIFGNDAIESPCIRDSDCSCKSDTNKIFKGHISLGYGSGTTYFNYTVDPYTAIKSRAEKEGIKILSSNNIIETEETIEGHKIEVGKEDIETAKKIAAKANICIIFISADSGEQYINLEKSIGDRYDLDAWHSGNDLIEAVSEKNENVIVIINSPGPVNLPWFNKIKGLIMSGFGGAESGNGIVDVLFGDYNPSGHLPYVWGELENYPSKIKLFSNPTEYNYNEGVFVGQRYFDKNNKTYYFPFGYGISYTTFEFDKDKGISTEMTKEGLKIKFNMKNIGDIEGETVPMVFLKFPENIETQEGYPDKLFKGFDKKLIKPGENVDFEILIDEHALSYFNVNEHKFVRPTEGKYNVYVGFNAEEYDILTKEVDAKY